MAPALISLGYEGRSVNELMHKLIEFNVAVLADVRLTPLSRKPGLSKRQLEHALTEAGIVYIHLPALGNPKDNRELFRAGDPDSRHKFRDLLLSAPGEYALRHVAELLDDQTVALMCFERWHGDCHRHLVAEELRRSIPELELVTI
jgi:uncharacterized protein (DUF488 family)